MLQEVKEESDTPSWPFDTAAGEFEKAKLCEKTQEDLEGIGVNEEDVELALGFSPSRCFLVASQIPKIEAAYSFKIQQKCLKLI